jgi:hypothetical protein
MVQLLLAMSFACHLMACGWVSIGRVGVLSGEDSWFNNDIYGPFVAKDTTGGQWVSTIYLSAFYFALTTMTSETSLLKYARPIPKYSRKSGVVPFMRCRVRRSEHKEQH